MALEPITLSEEELRALDDKVPTGTKVYAKDSEEDLTPTSEELSAEVEARKEASMRWLENASRPSQQLDPKIAYALGDHPGLESITLSDEEVEQIVAAAYAKPSGWEKAWFGARTTGGLVENTARFLTRAALAATGDETWESAGELSRMNRRERGKSASLATALRPDLQDDTSVVAGMIGGAVADPTSLIALAPKAMTSLVGGRATLAAVLTGAGLGGGDALMAQAAHEDEIDWGMVGGAALLGGGIGGILHAAGSAIANRFAKTLDDKSRAGVPITMDDAQRIIDEAEIQGTARRMDDPRLGMEANRVDYDDVIEGEVVVPEARRTADSIGMERNRVEGGSPIEGEFYEIMENAGKLRNEVAQAITEKNPSRLLGLLRKANPYPITDNLSKRILKEENGFNPFSSVADEEVEYLRRNYGLPDKVEQELPSAVAAWERVPKDGRYEFHDGNAMYTISKGNKRSSKWELYRSAGKGKGKRIGQYKTLASAKRSGQAHMDGRYKVEVVWPTDRNSVVKLRDTKTGQIIPEKFINRRAALERREELMKQAEQKEADDLRKLRRAKKDMAGFADNQFLTTVSGGLGGYALSGGDVEWALMGALGGAAVPKLLSLAARHPDGRTPLSQAHIDAHVALAYIARKPLNVLRDKLGDLGEGFVEQLKLARNDNDRWLARKYKYMRNSEMQAKARGYTDEAILEAKHEAMEILKGNRVAGSNKLANGMVRDWRKLMDDTLTDAYNSGIIDTEKYARLKQRANQRGYFPRVYDEVFLNSEEGQDAWVKALSGKEVSEPKARALLQAVVGNKEVESQVLSKAQRRGGKIIIDENFAKIMLQARRSKHVGARSNHLEKGRKLPSEFEELLAPFLVKDPYEALSRYLLDSGNRINHAKRFGAKDEKAHVIFDAIGKQYGTPAMRLAEEIYYARVGDTLSTNVKAAVEMNDTWRTINGRVDAFETLKLAMGQVTNAGQVPINASVLAAKLTGGSPKAMMKMWIDMADQLKSGKIRGEDAARMGANIEATLMQLMGESGSMHHRIMGKSFSDIHTSGGKIFKNPVEYLNNPTEFLKKTGFLTVEDINRALASNIGRGIGQQLIDEMVQLRKVGTKPSKRLIEGMKELGMDPHANSWGRADLDRAGLRFSDSVNFRNSPGELPILWQHPNAQAFRKFKSFAFNHASFLMDNIVRPLYRKNIQGGAGAAAAYAVIGGVTGMGVDEVKRMVKGDDSDLTMTERYIRGVTAAGGLGIWMDLMRSYNPLTSALGPAASDLDRLIREGKQTVAGNQGPGKMISDLAKGTLVIPYEKQLFSEINDLLNLD